MDLLSYQKHTRLQVSRIRESHGNTFERESGSRGSITDVKLVMFDHLLGRPPSPGYRRTQVSLSSHSYYYALIYQILLIIFFWLWRAFADAKGPRLLYLRRINRTLSRLNFDLSNTNLLKSIYR